MVDQLRRRDRDARVARVLRLVCTCKCHDCCVPQWASCGECDENHPED